MVEDLGEDQLGVVVALLGPVPELPGLVQQGADGRYAVGLEEGQAQRLLDVPGKVVVGAQVADPLPVGRRVQRFDFGQGKGAADDVRILPSGSAASLGSHDVTLQRGQLAFDVVVGAGLLQPRVEAAAR